MSTGLEVDPTCQRVLPGNAIARAHTPPFRAEHVGSLLRPSDLLDARARHSRGEISEIELRQIENAAVRYVVKLQEDLGFESVTDGELRRTTWHSDFLYQIAGVSRRRVLASWHNDGGRVELTPDAPCIEDKLALRHCIFAGDFQFLSSVTSAVPKLSIPAPSLMHYRGGRSFVSSTAYPNMDDFWHDVGRVYATEVAELGRIGCTYLQLDDTGLAYLNDPRQRAYMASLGCDASSLHLTYIQVMNHALSGRPPGMSVCTHLCRGNYKSSWVASGGYDYVADALFSQLAVDGFFLEYDDYRSGDFAPLRFVPKGKKVVLGLVTSKRGRLERKDDIKRRIDAAARFVPLEQLCLSPQCGFASTVDGNHLTFEEQVAKLRLVIDTAREVWG